MYFGIPEQNCSHRVWHFMYNAARKPLLRLCSHLQQIPKVFKQASCTAVNMQYFNIQEKFSSINQTLPNCLHKFRQSAIHNSSAQMKTERGGWEKKELFLIRRFLVTSVFCFLNCVVHILWQKSPWCPALHAFPQQKLLPQFLAKTRMDQTTEVRTQQAQNSTRLSERKQAEVRYMGGGTTLKTLYQLRWIDCPEKLLHQI